MNKLLKNRVTILLISLVVLIVFIVGLIIKNKIDGSTLDKNIREVVDLGAVSGNHCFARFDGAISYEEYMATHGVDIVIVAEVDEHEVVEVIDLGNVGIFGSQLNIDNIDDSEWTIDTDIQNASVVANGRPIREPIYDDQGNQINNQPAPDTPVISGPTGERPAVAEYVSASNSAQAMNYIVYSPENANENTPVFLYLHGIGENGAGYDKFISTYSFLKYLISGSWQPDVIIVSPILTRGSSWKNESSQLNTILSEVITNYGGSWNNLYIGGFSAGADAITTLAQSITFQGAIYIAGHLGCSGNTTDVNTFLSIWSGKPVFYYRDTLYGSGGYGYSASYVQSCQDLCSNYNVSFMAVDMNWGHLSALVDAVFLPNYYMDSKGAYCKDAIESLVYFW